MKTNYEISNHLSLNARPEVLEMIASISELKNIKEQHIITIMEDVLTKIAVAKYGSNHNVRVRIYKNNGAILVERVITVVEEVENPDSEISLEEAQVSNPAAKIGDEILEELPPLEFTRNIMQKSLSALMGSVKELEKQREYNSYKDSVGELVSGVVKRIEYGNCVIDLGNNAEGFLNRNQSIFKENIAIGDRVRALIIEVKENPKGPQVMLSRSAPNFVVKLFSQEIPEVFDGVVEIKAIAREAGSRTKMIVASNNPAVDPVGVCIGYRGAKINGILEELKGEKIDLIKYSEHFVTLVENAFWPVQVLKTVAEEDRETLNVVVDETKLSLVIGRGGQSIRLVSKLLGWKIDVMTEEEEKEKRQKLTQEKVAAFMEALDVDEVVGHLLILSGYGTVQELAEAHLEELMKIEDFDEELSIELINRAKDYLQKRLEFTNSKLKELEVTQDLIDFELLSGEHKLTLGNNGVRTLQDLADLSSFELLDILEASKDMNMKKVENIIMTAREAVMGKDEGEIGDNNE